MGNIELHEQKHGNSIERNRSRSDLFHARENNLQPLAVVLENIWPQGI